MSAARVVSVNNKHCVVLVDSKLETMLAILIAAFGLSTWLPCALLVIVGATALRTIGASNAIFRVARDVERTEDTGKMVCVVA